jgi:hypothetical protein
VLDRGKEIPYRATHPLGRGVGGDEKRIFFLETDQFSQHRVVLSVGYLRLVEDVIAIAVISELLAQLFDSLFDFLGYRWSAWHGLDDAIRSVK